MEPASDLPEGPGFSRAVVDAARNATIGVVVARSDASGTFSEFASERVATLLGASPRVIPGDLALAEEATTALERWLASDGSTPLLLDAVVARVTNRVLRVVASRVEEDGRAAVVLFFYDAAESKAERALAESEARFRRVLDLAPDSIGISTATRFVYANPAFVRTLGYPNMNEVTRIPLIEHIHPEDRVLARGIARSVLGTGKPTPATRLRALGKDATVVPVDLRVLAIEWGGERALIGISRDLTERRDTQAQVIRADRLSAMGTLAAGVAHEINNPLAYLMLNLQYLMRELPRFDGEPTKRAALLERLSEAEHGARRVSAIVGDLKTFARPEQHDRGPVSVPSIVMAAAKVAGPQIYERARLVESYEDVPLVDASAARLEQVFINLLVNAAHAIPEGAPADHEISATVRAEGERVVVEVRDTGVGIPLDMQSRVFDPFFTTKPRGVGTGLGLPISRGIVISAGGDISVSSTPGVGTLFRVTLPAMADSDRPPPPSRDRPPPPEPSAPSAAISSSSLAVRGRVLVVDDEPLVADMLRRALADAHDVAIETDAAAALAYVLSGKELDVIFCDLLMPIMSGMDLYDEVRQKRPGVEEKIVFMTGGAFTERAAVFLASVPNPKLSKPFDLGELERVVTRALRRRK
jgi:PAS domain S-box-containing protein